MSERNVCANREVHLMFETLVQEWFAESVDDYNDFIKALLVWICIQGEDCADRRQISSSYRLLLYCRMVSSRVV